MNKLLLFLLFFISINTLKAQYNSKEIDLISRFKPGVMWFYSGFKPSTKENIRKYDRLIFDFTYNDWNGDVDLFKNSLSSIGLNTNFLFDIPITKNNTISFGTGISHSLFRIAHHNQFNIDSTNSFTSFDAFSIKDDKRRLLGGNSISIPLEFRFRTNGWKHFKFHIGGKIGYQLNMYSKTVWNGEFGRNVLKTNNFPDVERLIYSAHVRIGVRNWALIASYNLNPLFSNSESTQLNLVQMGLSLSLF